MSNSQNGLFRRQADNSFEKMATTGGGGGGGSTATIVVNNSTGDLTGASIVVKYGSTVISTTNHIGDNIQVGAIGVYTIECGVYSVDVTVTALGAMIYADVNTTDSWKLWVEAGGLDATDYDNLAEVLADEKAVRRLMTIHDAVDFLATGNKNASLISTIISDNYCAKWINLRDYALDTLYANEDIAELMDTADKYFYGEWVNNNGTWGPKGNVPVMTSNTAPYGEASASSETTNYPAYHAFIDDIYTQGSGWCPSSSDSIGSAYVQYKSTNPICVKRVRCNISDSRVLSPQVSSTFELYASNDGVDWTKLAGNLVSKGEGIINYYNIDNNNYYLYYKFVLIYVASGGVTAYGGYHFQFYGREMKVSVPTMTSNTAPYGDALASGELGSNKAYKVFDGDLTTYWENSSDSYPNYIGYSFTNPVCIRMVSIVPTGRYYSRIKDFKVQGSNDGTNWTDIYEGEITNSTIDVLSSFNFNNSNNYLKYRIYITSGHDTTNTGYSDTKLLQFYGFDYSEYDWDTEHPRHYIYDHGVEFSDAITTNVTGNGVISRRTNDLYVYDPDNSSRAIFDIKSLIDFTDYDLIRVISGDELVGNSSGIYWITVSSTNDILTSYTNRVAFGWITSTYVPEHGSLDVSSLNSSYYLSWGLGSNNSGNKGTIKELWLE